MVKNINYVKDGEQHDNVYIYDLETYARKSDNYFDPYSAGFVNLKHFNKNYKWFVKNGSKDDKLVKTHIKIVKKDENPAMLNMFLFIDKTNTKDDKNV